MPWHPLHGKQPRAPPLKARLVLPPLQGNLLVREALASAAVLLYAVAALPDQRPDTMALAIARGLLCPGEQLELPPAADSTSSSQQQQAGAGPGLLDTLLQQQGTSLVQQLQTLSPVGRICAIRGLLTCLPRATLCATLVHTPVRQPPRSWHLLADGVLPAACAAVETAPDAHYKFHASCTLLSCLQKAQACWAAVLAPADAKVAHRQRGGGAGEADGGTEGWSLPEISAGQRQRVMSLVWGNMEEPLAQTTRRLQEALEALLDIVQLQEQAEAQQAAAAATGSTSGDITSSHSASGDITSSHSASGAGTSCSSSSGGGGVYQQFLQATAARLLGMSPGRKGRYVPLSTLVPRVGGRALLAMEPRLVSQALHAMADDMCANSAAALLKELLQQLQREAGQRQDGHTAGAGAAGGSAGAGGKAWLAWWLPALLGVLLEGGDKLRAYVAAHALPVVFELDGSLLGDILAALLAPKAGDGGAVGAAAAQLSAGAADASQLAAFVCVLKAARRQQLVGDLDALAAAPELAALQPCQLLVEAVAHCSESIRLDCLELACINPR
jgi:hypothetical protein